MTIDRMTIDRITIDQMTIGRSIDRSIVVAPTSSTSERYLYMSTTELNPRKIVVQWTAYRPRRATVIMLTRLAVVNEEGGEG